MQGVHRARGCQEGTRILRRLSKSKISEEITQGVCRRQNYSKSKRSEGIMQGVRKRRTYSKSKISEGIT
jgi:hypothetical protein